MTKMIEYGHWRRNVHSLKWKPVYTPFLQFLKEVNTMLKEVQMTFRVDPQLRAEISNATALADRPAPKARRELMRANVTEPTARAYSLAIGLVSPAESRRREKAVNFPRACV